MCAYTEREGGREGGRERMYVCVEWITSFFLSQQ